MYERCNWIWDKHETQYSGLCAHYFLTTIWCINDVTDATHLKEMF